KQTPAAGTTLKDTGAPTITVMLERTSYPEKGEPEDVSPYIGTSVQPIGLKPAPAVPATPAPEPAVAPKVPKTAAPAATPAKRPPERARRPHGARGGRSEGEVIAWVLRRLRGEAGFTLVEMITVMAIMSVVFAGITTAFVSASKAQNDQDRRFRAQLNTRLAL